MTGDGIYPYPEMVSLLKKANATANNGRGVKSIKSYITLIESRLFAQAHALLNTEWDKIRNYPSIVEVLRQTGVIGEDERF